MPATRLMPSEEASDLIASDPRHRGQGAGAQGRADRGVGGVPARGVPDARAGRDCCRCPIRRSSAAAGSRTRSTCRCWRRSRAVSASVGVGVSVHALVVLRPVHRRHRRAAQAVAAGDAVRRPARRLLPVGGARRLGPRGDEDRGPCVTATRTCSTARRRGPRTAARPTSTRSWPARPTTAAAGSPASSCRLTPPGLSADHPEQKMGLMGSTTATMLFDDVRIPAERRLGDEGQGLPIALAGLDSGRLGIAAVATGLAQGALDAAVAYAKERQTFGKAIIDHQGLGLRAGRHGRRRRVGAGDLPGGGPPQGRRAEVLAGRPPSPSWWAPTTP